MQNELTDAPASTSRRGFLRTGTLAAGLMAIPIVGTFASDAKAFGGAGGDTDLGRSLAQARRERPPPRTGGRDDGGRGEGQLAEDAVGLGEQETHAIDAQPAHQPLNDDEPEHEGDRPSARPRRVAKAPTSPSDEGGNRDGGEAGEDVREVFVNVLVDPATAATER